MNDNISPQSNIKDTNTVEYPKSVVNVKPKKVRAPRLRSKHPAPTKGAFGNGRKDTRIQNKKTVFIKQFEAEVSKHYAENEKEYKEAGLTYEQVYAIIAQKFIDGELK